MVFESGADGTPSPPHVIQQFDADPVTTRYFPLAYWGSLHPHLTPSGEYLINTEEVNPTSHRFVSRKLPNDDLGEENLDYTGQDQDDLPVYLDNVVCYSSRLADGDRFLLLGDNDDKEMRLLIAPREGRALEIKPLSLSFNEVKRRLEAEWRKRRVLRDKEMEETGKQDPAIGGELVQR